MFRARLTRLDGKFSMAEGRISGVPKAAYCKANGLKKELMAQKAKIDTYHVHILSYFLDKMRSTPEGDGSLLDHSLVLYGSGLGDGNLHRHSDLPVLLAGKLSGKFQTGYHFDYKENTPMANLLVTMLDSVGVHVEKLGDSTGRLLLDYQQIA